MNAVATKPVDFAEATDIILEAMDALAEVQSVHGVGLVWIQHPDSKLVPKPAKVKVGESNLDDVATMTMAHMLRVREDPGINEALQGERSIEGDGIYSKVVSFGETREVFVVFQCDEADPDIPLGIILHGLTELQKVLSRRPWAN